MKYYFNAAITKHGSKKIYTVILFCLTLFITVTMFSLNSYIKSHAATAPVDILITTSNGKLNDLQTLALTHMDVGSLSLIYQTDNDKCIYEGKLSLSDTFTYNDKLDLIKDLPYIYRAEYDTSLKTDVNLFNDTFYSSQWSLDYIDAPEAYELIGSTPGDDVVVAVIDTGVDYTHNDIKNNMWVNEAEANGIKDFDDDGNGYVDDIYGYNFTSNADDPSDPKDDASDSHGSHVAGIIAMQENNNIGGVGVAYGSKIMALKAGDSQGHFSASNVIKAAQYAVKNGADVINLSLGTKSLSTSIASLGLVLNDISKKCITVAAAGNESTPTAEAADFGYNGTCYDTYPAAFSSVIGVMSSDKKNSLSSFSNWDYKNGTDKDYEIIAPGSNIYSLKIGNMYQSESGTSMATPLVAGAIADLISYYKKHNLTYNSELIKQQLIRSTTHTIDYTDSCNETHTFKAINLYDAISNMPSPDLKITDTSFYNTQNDELLTSSEVSYNNNIAFNFTLSNDFVKADNIKIKLQCSDPATYSYVTFLNQSVDIESLDFSESCTLKYDNDECIRFKLNDDFPETGAALSFLVTVTASNGWDSSDNKEYSFVDYYTLNITSYNSAGSVDLETASPNILPTVSPIADSTQSPSSTPEASQTREPEPTSTPTSSEIPSSAPESTQTPIVTTESPAPIPTGTPDIIVTKPSAESSNSPQPTADSKPTADAKPSSTPCSNTSETNPTQTPGLNSPVEVNPTSTSKPLSSPAVSSIEASWYSKLSVYSTRNLLYYGGNSGNTAYITISGIPSGYSISYLSNNTKILKVSKYGKMTAKGKGTATISTILTNNTTGDQYIYLSTIVVKKASISLSATKMKLIKGRKYMVRVTTKGIKKASLIFASSNTDVASVNRRTGLIKALLSGRTDISVKFSKIKRKLSVTITSKK